MRSTPYIDQDGHTLTTYVRLYREGKIGPLRYASDRIPVVPCRNCKRSRSDDGTRCGFCGAYQRCTFEVMATSPAPEERRVQQLPEEWPHKVINKVINPRRKHHV